MIALHCSVVWKRENINGTRVFLSFTNHAHKEKIATREYAHVHVCMMRFSSNFLNSITNVNASRSGEVVDDARHVAIELRGVLRELVSRSYPLVFTPFLPFHTRECAVNWLCDNTQMAVKKSIQRTTPYRAYTVRLLCFAAFSSSRGSYSGASDKSAQNHARSRAFLCNTLGTWRNRYKMQDHIFK